MKNYKDVIQQFKPEMEKAVEFLKTELKLYTLVGEKCL